MITSLTPSASSRTARTSASFSSYLTALDRSEMGSSSSLIPSRALRWCQWGHPLVRYGQNALEQGHPSLGFISIPYGGALQIKPVQPPEHGLTLPLYPFWFLLAGQGR